MNGEMAVPTDKIKESKRVEKLTLNSDSIEGLDQLTVDQEVTIKVKAKVLNIGKHVYDENDKEKPMEAEFEVVSGAIEGHDKKVMDKMDSAQTFEELDKAVKGDE